MKEFLLIVTAISIFVISLVSVILWFNHKHNQMMIDAGYRYEFVKGQYGQQWVKPEENK